jgi:hypothetical protein
MAEDFHMRLFVGTVLLLSTGLAQAYVGPGLGIGVVGAILGFLAAIVLAVIGMVWYPIKRMLRARSAARGARSEAEAGLEADSASALEPMPEPGQEPRS